MKLLLGRYSGSPSIHFSADNRSNQNSGPNLTSYKIIPSDDKQDILEAIQATKFANDDPEGSYEAPAGIDFKIDKPLLRGD